MQFSDQWKQNWAISSTFSPPLLIQNNPPTNSTNKDEIGPLIFNPSSKQTLIHLLSPPSSRFSPFPSLSLPRFLSTSSSALLTTTSSVAVNELSSLYNDDKFKHCYNSLQLLRCPRKPVLYAFFPAGDNLEKIGFLVISVKTSIFEVKSNNGNPFFVDDKRNNHHHRILKLLINPVDDFGGTTSLTIGYMLAFSNYCVCWYSVKVNSNLELASDFPVVESLGFKCFRNSSIVHVCWSPHFDEQSVVLLENGELFLFDLMSSSKNKKLQGKKLQISWDIDCDLGKNSESGWLSCEFSWHPEILIVAHSSSIYLVDMRSIDKNKKIDMGSGRCEVSCLLKIAMFSTRKSDSFLALSKAGLDGFRFVVASQELLLLCDVRNPMMPLLRWVHSLCNPNHLTVLRLSELRSNSKQKEDMYKWASESGYCILLGSFSDCEFNLFCYGPDNRKGFSFSKMPCAWGLPLEILLSGCDSCHCGTCLVREEFAKDSLLPWIDWRQKKDLVLGFAIFDSFEADDTYGGFSLVRLMSSGKLEVQKYCAAWEFEHISEVFHKGSFLDFEDNFLHDFGEVKYDFSKRNSFLVLDNLREYIRKDISIATDSVHSDMEAVSLGEDAPWTPVRSQERASKVKHEVVRGVEIFDDEGCLIDLKLDDLAMDCGQNELKMYKLLRGHNLKFQKGFKL